MSFGNKFYRVDTPIRVWRHVGMSPSNHYYGSSRLTATVMHAENAKPGDEIHALLGGTFLVRGGETFPITFTPPKASMFEKTYMVVSSSDVMDGYVKQERATAIPEPKLKANYRAAREAVENNRLQDHLPAVVEVEPSPELELVKDVAQHIAYELDGEVEVRSKAWDVDAYEPARAKVTVGDEVIEIRAFSHRTDLRVSMPFERAEAAGIASDTQRTDSGKAYAWVDDEEFAKAIVRSYAPAQALGA